jgi:hypothetical protein
MRELALSCSDPCVLGLRDARHLRAFLNSWIAECEAAAKRRKTEPLAKRNFERKAGLK